MLVRLDPDEARKRILSAVEVAEGDTRLTVQILDVPRSILYRAIRDLNMMPALNELRVSRGWTSTGWTLHQKKTGHLSAASDTCPDTCPGKVDGVEEPTPQKTSKSKG